MMGSRLDHFVTGFGLHQLAVQARLTDRVSWLQLARDVEAAGFRALYTADHPGTSPAPFVALAAAAAVTERINLGTCVVNAGVWEPMDLGNEVATLDLISGGRAVLGLGSGHTPMEWTSSGRSYPSAANRVARMIEVAETTMALLAGERVTYQGDHVNLHDAFLENPKPVQRPVPLMVGGNGSQVLKFAAAHADIVGFTGLGPTLADGHTHQAKWSPDDVQERLDLIHSAARTSGPRSDGAPKIEALIQFVEVTDDAEAAASKLIEPHDTFTVEDILSAPFVWIGTLAEIRNKLDRFQKLGIDYYVIRAPALGDALRIFGND